jgi:predicted TIM-barrel fold metal-dependent hydrolase
MIVDASVHVWSGDAARYPWAPLGGVAVPAAPSPTERMLADLEAAGVTGAVAVQPRSYGYDHAYLAEALAHHPGRIAGVCLVDPDDAHAPERLAQLHGRGFRGLRLISIAGDRDGLAGAHLHPLLEHAAALGMSASVLAEPARLAALGRVAAAHPATTVIVDHLGLCNAATPGAETAALMTLARLPNVCLRLSAFTALSAAGFPFADLVPLLRDAYRAFGGSRLLWGTDYPYVLESGSYAQSLEAVRSHMPFIAPGDRPAILGGTAARLYHLAGVAS